VLGIGDSGGAILDESLNQAVNSLDDSVLSEGGAVFEPITAGNGALPS